MSIRPDSTMFAALHGELALHPWRDPRVASSDAYSLFVARSSALGWLTEATENASGGLWGMNDAGQGPEPSRIAWFQVSLTEPVPDGRPLPVQAFLSCAGDVVARIGTPRLRAVQLLLPVQSLDASTRASAVLPLFQDAGWFADGDPRWRTPVRVTLDGGQDPSIHSAAPEMLQWIRSFTQDVFACDSFSLTDDLTDDGMVLEPAVIDELWRGPARHRATFHGVLTEWSLDALGWLAAFLAEAASRNGVGTPLMLTADRLEGSRSRVD
ncbi:hypothetical protein [Streptosporangium amethystogenes]|uniref:hypothetical protein n=1 Tax=Streptosporangium amethystogenes TaxID=2002 RepID=UPI000B03F955|nr:hypothetical protein [Streptosporangium amethystogenes]